MRALVEIAFIIIISISSIDSHNIEYLNNDILGENDNCKHSENHIGKCQKISDCQDEFVKYLRNHTVLKICQYIKNDIDSLICCPQNVQRPIKQKFDADYFNIEKCRDRHLIYRKYRKNARDLLDQTNNSNLPSINDIDENDPFYHILREPRVHESDYQFMAAIGWTQTDKSINYLATGVIISDRFILSNAHIIHLRERRPDTVRIGDRFLNSTEDDMHAEQLRILKMSVHLNYTKDAEYNDIALIKISGNIKFKNYVAPACIGKINDKFVQLKLGSFLQTESMKINEIAVQLYPFDKCNEIFQKYKSFGNGIQSSQFCTYNDPNVNDTCDGSSGNPVKYDYLYNLKDLNYDQTKLRSIYDIPVVIGFTSIKSQCTNGTAIAHTRISHYIDWIIHLINTI